MDKNIDQAMADFLANGGVIQQGAYRESGRVEGAFVNPWGAKKAGRPAKTDTVPEQDNFEDEE
jgi:hypothetical protein